MRLSYLEISTPVRTHNTIADHGCIVYKRLSTECFCCARDDRSIWRCVERQQLDRCSR
jgi:hypothetical protein